MNETNNWYEDLEDRINSLNERMVGDGPKFLQLDKLLNLSKEISIFSRQCNECSTLEKQITEVVDGLSDWPRITYKQQKDYESTLKIVNRHLKKTHELIAAGTYTGTNTPRNLGLIIMAIGVALVGSSFLWGIIDPMSLGPVASLTIGALLFLFGLILIIGFYIYILTVRK